MDKVRLQIIFHCLVSQLIGRQDNFLLLHPLQLAVVTYSYINFLTCYILAKTRSDIVLNVAMPIKIMIFIQNLQLYLQVPDINNQYRKCDLIQITRKPSVANQLYFFSTVFFVCFTVIRLCYQRFLETHCSSIHNTLINCRDSRM